jgi:hypothetical protein
MAGALALCGEPTTLPKPAPTALRPGDDHSETLPAERSVSEILKPDDVLTPEQLAQRLQVKVSCVYENRVIVEIASARYRC